MATPCPECGAADLARDDSGSFRCSACGLVTPNVDIPCPSCGASVGVLAEQCPTCGEPMTMFAQVMSRHDGKGRAPVWLSQARARASDVRQDEDEASRKRFGALEEIDRRRLEAQARDAMAQSTKDRRILLVGLAVSVALGAVFLFVALAIRLR